MTERTISITTKVISETVCTLYETGSNKEILLPGSEIGLAVRRLVGCYSHHLNESDSSS
jgi:hypothetical protein